MIFIHSTILTCFIFLPGRAAWQPLPPWQCGTAPAMDDSWVPEKPWMGSMRQDLMAIYCGFHWDIQIYTYIYMYRAISWYGALSQDGGLWQLWQRGRMIRNHQIVTFRQNHTNCLPRNLNIGGLLISGHHFPPRKTRTPHYAKSNARFGMSEPNKMSYVKQYISIYVIWK